MARLNFKLADSLADQRKSETSSFNDSYLEQIILTALNDRRQRWRNRFEFVWLGRELLAQSTYKKYTIGEGDTIDTLSDRSGYAPIILCYLNPGIKSDQLVPGNVLNMPEGSEIGTNTGDSVKPVDASLTDAEKTQQVTTGQSNENTNLSLVQPEVTGATSTGTDANETVTDLTGTTNTDASATDVTGTTNTTVPENNTATTTGNNTATTTNTTQSEGEVINEPGTTNISEDDLVALDDIWVNDAPVNEKATGDTQTELVPAAAPLLVLPADRSDIVSIWRELTATQKEKYYWTELLKVFTEAQPKVSATNLAAWTRKKLKEGWNFGDPVPLLMATIKAGEKNGAPIVEAYSFSSAWQYAAKTLALPKNADAPFYWRRKFSGTMSYHYLNYSSNTAWKNYVNLKDHADWNAAQLLLDVSGDKTNYDAVVKIKTYNDQLLSEYFVSLVISAQSMMYASETDGDDKINGIFTATTLADLKKKKSDNIAAAKKAEADKAALFGEAGLPSTPSGVYRFKRTLPEGVFELRINRKKWQDLKSYIKSNTDTDYLVDHVTLHFPPGDKESKDIFYMLTHAERIKVLEAFEKEYWLWEEQEKIVNMLIEHTPTDKDATNSSVTNMRTSLWNWLNANNRYHYNEIMEDQENDETRRGYYTSTEEVSVQKENDVAQVDKTPEALVLQYAESVSTYEALHLTLYGMSDRQLAAIGYTGTGTARTFNGTAFIKIAAAETTFMLTNIFRGGEALYRLLKFAGTDGYMKTFLGAENNLWLDLARKGMGDSYYKKLMTERLDKIFTGDSRSLKTATSLITNPEALGSGRNYESYLASLPSTVYAAMTADQQAELIMLVNKGSYTDGTDEETIIRIIESAGTLTKKKIAKAKTEDEKKLLEAQEQKERHDLYDAIHAKDPNLVKLKDGFQFYNEDLLLLKIKGLVGELLDINAYDRKVQKADYYSKDDVIRSMPAAAMAKLTLEKRKEYIKTLLGRTPEEDKMRQQQTYGTYTSIVLFTRVGQADEEALIRLLNTTPGEQLTDILAWLQANHGEFYSELHSAIDGDQFKELHDTLDTLATSKLEAETKNNPEKAKQLEAQRDQMLYQGAAHPKVVPWADPGFFKQFYADHSYEFIVKWTDKNNIALTYYDPRNLKGGIKTKGPFSPWEYIGVEFLDDDADLNADRGEIRMMPAIYLFFLENKQTQRQIGEALDLIFLAVGVGELLAAVKTIQLVIAAIDVALTVGSLVTNSYKEEIPKDLKAAFDIANIAFSFYQVAKLGKVVVQESWQVAEKFITKLDEAVLNGTITGGAAKTMQAEADRLKKMKELAERIDDADVDELKAMQKKVNESNMTAGEKADINADLSRRIKSREHNLKYEADRQRIADNNKPKTDAGDGVPKTDVGGGTTTPVIDTQKAVATATDDSGNAFTIQHPEWGTVQFVRHDGKWFLVNAKNYPADMRVKIVQRYSSQNMDSLRETWLKTKDPNAVKNPVEGTNTQPDVTVKEPEVVKTDDAANTQGDVTVKDPEVVKDPDPVKVDEANVKNVDETKLSEPELQKIEEDLLAEQGARTWRDEAAEEFLAKNNAKAMYVPGEPGKPGVLVFSRNATRSEILEEIKHLKQHKSLKFAALTTEQIIQLEIEAQQQLIRYARMKKWSDAEIKQFEDNLKYWEAKKAEYAKGGDAAKAVEAEVQGFRMADHPDGSGPESKGTRLPTLDEVTVSPLYKRVAIETDINDIALGVNQQQELEIFIENVRSWIYKNWDIVGLYNTTKNYGWGRVFYDSLFSCIANGGKINFNLDGLDIAKALNDPDYMTWVGRYTAWELQQIVRNPVFLDNTVFYLGGRILSKEEVLALGIKPYPKLTTEELRQNALID